MTLMVIFLIMVIVTALVFEYINGFHDAANAIATIVSTRVLSPRAAVIFGGSLDFVGALLGTHVAKTIGSGIVNPDAVTLKVILCALLAAVVWNLFTWFLGLPSSSSHALIGGLLGAGVMHSGIGCVSFLTLIDKVIIPMFASPIVGFVVGFIFMLFLLRLFYKKNPDKVNRRFRRFQLLSSGLMALSHGSNDAQKTMGIISLALLVGGVLDTPVVEVAVELRLVDGVHRAEAHRDRRELPERGHAVRVGVGGHAVLGLALLLPEAVHVLLGQAALEEGAGVHAR